MDDIVLELGEDMPSAEALREGTWYAGETWVCGSGVDNVPVDERDLHLIGRHCPCEPILLNGDETLRTHRVGRLSAK